MTKQNYSNRRPKGYLLAHNVVRIVAVDQPNGLNGFRRFSSSCGRQ